LWRGRARSIARQVPTIGGCWWSKKSIGGSSNEKAKELKISDFGKPEEVREMAVMPRSAKTKDEAKTLMEKIQNNGPIGNRAIPTLRAALSRTSINKILNNKAKNQSFSEEAHLLAAVNVNKLFFNAIEPWKFEIDPRKPNVQLADRRFFYSPMEFKGRIVPVKMTILEFQNKDVNLYSIEAIDVVVKQKGMRVYWAFPEYPLVTPSTHPFLRR
jgi:hypothetical protein